MDIFSSSSSSFQDEFLHEDMTFWDLSPDPFDPMTASHCLLPPPLEPPPPVVPLSAFSRYVRPEASSSRLSNGKKNVHQRVVEYLRQIPRDKPESRSEEHSRGFRHMMRERQRRERLSQSYADLYSMLPYRSKADKNSIVQLAAAYVKELKGVKEELLRRNEELKVRSARKSDLEGGVKIKIRVGNPASTLDSMIGALHCLKEMNVKATAIQTEFFGHELTAIMTIETKFGASEVERALTESCR